MYRQVKLRRQIPSPDELCQTCRRESLAPARGWSSSMRMREPYRAAGDGHQTGTPTHPGIFLKSPSQARYTVPTIISYLTMCGISRHRIRQRLMRVKQLPFMLRLF